MTQSESRSRLLADRLETDLDHVPWPGGAFTTTEEEAREIVALLRSETAGRKRYSFVRVRNGRVMAEGIAVHAESIEDAFTKATRFQAADEIGRETLYLESVENAATQRAVASAGLATQHATAAAACSTRRPRPGDGTDCQKGYHCSFPECACPRSSTPTERAGRKQG